MKLPILPLFLFLSLPAMAGAGWWAENDYATGANGLKKDSLTVFTNITRKLIAGGSAAFYHDDVYQDKVYSFRLPLMYSGRRHFLSLTPFVYPVTPGTHSGAKGARLYVQTSITEPDDENYLYVTAGGAWAGQTARLGNAADRKSFSETAVELQMEKSYFGQFFLLASAAAFSKTGNTAGLATPALDHSDMAYMGTFRQITGLPDWVMSAQVTRNMKPEYASHLYIGYSKISFRRVPMASSLILGIKLELTKKTTLDLAYNAFKMEDDGYTNYYKILVRTVF